MMSTFVLVQRGSWPGWSPNADIYLESETAAAYLTAARDYQAETGRTDAGVVEPAGGLRTAAEIAEMQWAFDHRGTAESAALYQKYNMDPNSNARPATSTTHLLGICVDVASSAFLNWMITNGGRYGFRRTVAGAPLFDIRHFQFFPGTATAALDVTSLDGSQPTSAPAPNPLFTSTKDNDMIALKLVDGGGKLGPVGTTRTYVFTPDVFWETTGDGSANLVSVIANGLAPGASGLTVVYQDVPNLTYAEAHKYAALAARCDPALLNALATAAA